MRFARIGLGGPAGDDVTRRAVLFCPIEVARSAAETYFYLALYPPSYDFHEPPPRPTEPSTYPLSCLQKCLLGNHMCAEVTPVSSLWRLCGLFVSNVSAVTLGLIILFGIIEACPNHRSFNLQLLNMYSIVGRLGMAHFTL